MQALCQWNLAPQATWAHRPGSQRSWRWFDVAACTHPLHLGCLVERAQQGCRKGSSACMHATCRATSNPLTSPSPAPALASAPPPPAEAAGRLAGRVSDPPAPALPASLTRCRLAAGASALAAACCSHSRNGMLAGWPPALPLSGVKAPACRASKQGCKHGWRSARQHVHVAVLAKANCQQGCAWHAGARLCEHAAWM